MHVTISGHEYTVLKDGKPLSGRNAAMEAFVAFAPANLRRVAVATFPSAWFGKKLGGKLRAMVFAADAAYIDLVVEAAEARWPAKRSRKGGHAHIERLPARRGS